MKQSNHQSFSKRAMINILILYNNSYTVTIGGVGIDVDVVVVVSIKSVRTPI